MKEVYGSAFETLVGAARAWLFPSTVAVGALSALLYQHWDTRGIVADIDRWTGTQQALLAGFVILGVATLLAATGRPTYRILEGYRLPERFRTKWREENKRRVNRLRAESAAASNALRADAQERLDHFPRKLRLVLPTRFETYCDRESLMARPNLDSTSSPCGTR